jgi:translation initiation factor 2 beta subunit (eIF-2beta)/eIF-5
MPLGNLRSQSIREIFHGQAYRDFVQAHLDDHLQAYPVCAKCDLKWDLEDSGRAAAM